jgi:hypothetical protein
MQVERRFEQVKDRRVLIELPDSFNNYRVEIIILTTDDAPPAHRRPIPTLPANSKFMAIFLTRFPKPTGICHDDRPRHAHLAVVDQPGSNPPQTGMDHPY